MDSVSVDGAVGEELEEVSLDVCEEVSVVVGALELALCDDCEEVSVQLAVLELEVVVDSDATSVTVKEEVVSLCVDDVLCEEVLVPEDVPVAALVVLLVDGEEVVVEC